jgi:hypothetical protein
MLVIKNIADIKNKEFSYAGKQWVLYGAYASNIEYRFIFMPKTTILDVYVIQNSQLVLLNRTKHNRRGYRLWTTDGTHTYVNTNDIRNWTELVEMVFKNKMIC